jgi:hypothetical protein
MALIEAEWRWKLPGEHEVRGRAQLHPDPAAAGSHGTIITILLAIIFAVIAAGILVPVAIRPVLALGVLTALAIWVVGEDFGGIFTGAGTDPNTGPLLILLAAAYWPRTQTRPGNRVAENQVARIAPGEAGT